MAAGQIQIQDTGLTINTSDYYWNAFALEVARATRRHLDEINEALKSAEDNGRKQE